MAQQEKEEAAHWHAWCCGLKWQVHTEGTVEQRGHQDFEA